MLRRMFITCAMIVVICGAPRVSRGAITVPSDGSDGAFNPAGAVVVDLSQAATGTWTNASPVAGKGIYDPAQWAVVFKYSSINISAGSQVTFINHPSGAPVVWLVQGAVTINGNVLLDGGAGAGGLDVYSTPGPGGFAGAPGALLAVPTAAGRGPGGGPAPVTNNNTTGNPGSYNYGNAAIVPLIGGSGGSSGDTPNYSNYGGGAGGGAILIAGGGAFSVGGLIRAQGGPGYSSVSGSGSGGAIRLIADTIGGTGQLTAIGGVAAVSVGGTGKIRVEANSILPGLVKGSLPPASVGVPASPIVVFPAVSAPTLQPLTLGGVAVPADPRPLNFPISDVVLTTPGSSPFVLQATNLPTNSTVVVRLVPYQGPETVVNASLVGGSLALSTWSVPLNMTSGLLASIQARAILP